MAVGVADLAGNPAEVSWTFTVDLTPPSVAVVEPAEVMVVGTATPAILVAYDDALSGVDLTSLAITVDAVDLTGSCAVGPSEATCTAPPLEAGGHTVRAEVHDRAGHGRVAERSFELVLDAEAPVVNITAPGDGATVNTPALEVTGTATDDGSVVSVVVNGVEAARTGDQFVAIVALAEGFNGLLAVATDSIGNEGVASGTVVLDTVPPEIRLERPASGQVVNGATVRVAGEVIDDRGVATVGVNGEDATLADGRFEATVPLSEGANVLTVTAVDLAGNVTETTREATRFTVPDVAITSPEDLAYIAATTVTVAGTVSEGVVSVIVNGVTASLSGTTFEAEGVPLIEGGNTVTATAAGTLGRVGTDTIHVVRDLTPPRVVIYRPAAGGVVHEPAVAVSGLLNDIVPGTVNESEAVVTVNGVPAQVSNRSFLAPEVSLLPGENVLVATATDASGNTAATEVRVHFEPPAGARLRGVSGDQQTAEIGTALPEPLVVELLDAAGQPVTGRPVAFYLRG
ncbi:MAG: Ig-like domain-containing protein, partial [Actinomycetota bacterium]